MSLTMVTEETAAVRYTTGDRDMRPWGQWEVLATGSRHTVKRITVEPGRRLSLQLHRHRSEHWIVVSGVATATVGRRTFQVAPNETVFIPAGTRHRVANDGREPLEMIEVQWGLILDENDIVRLEDDYQRR